jgi:hypothetical protein
MVIKAKAKAPATPLSKARGEYMTSTASVYGALRKYSETLTATLGEGWWKIPMKGPLSGNEAALRDAIRKEKAEVKVLAEKKQKVNPKYNIYKPWSDVLAYVDESKAKKGAGANVAREIRERIKIEVSKVYKAVKEHDNADDEDLAQANFHLGAALKAIGVDLTPMNDK